ncbi:twin-arginine translocase TatA/TatE family subunit [Pseudomonas boanensis]|uniref:twin-arginine translocase TatA/TatE family subunit n=1 Tax=Metapseudomonas boanensis TaxID=2822138 RepID=UPI0035D456F5
MGVFDWKHWAILLLVVLVLFGGKRLKSIGSDLGEAIKGFRASVGSDTSDANLSADSQEQINQRIV